MCSCSVLLKCALESRSNWPPIAAQSRSSSDTQRGEYKPSPQARTAQEPTRSEHRRVHSHAASFELGTRHLATQAISKEGGEMPGVESNSFHEAAHEQRQKGP